MSPHHTLRERPATYLGEAADDESRRSAADLPELALTALWLMGRVPADALPAPVLRPGRAGRGPGPDVREATVLTPSGVARTGDVEMHLRASDFVAHGHADDPAYAGVILHLCWEDDRAPAARGTPTPLPGGGLAPTVALQPVLRTGARVEALVARGPTGIEPCGTAIGRWGVEATAERVRAEGRRRLAERTWRAWRLIDRYDVDGAFDVLLERALAATAGRAREDTDRRADLAAAIRALFAPDVSTALVEMALRSAGEPRRVIETMRVGRPDAGGLGAGRAAEIAWNVVIPLTAALAAAYDDLPLARMTALLADRWPAPRPYGRTLTLGALVGRGRKSRGPGALYAQGLLHLQDLWCTRGGCGACPLSAPAWPVASS